MSELTLVIGNKNYSSWSLRPWIFLKQYQLEFDEKRIALFTDTTDDELSKYNSDLKVPVLQDGDLLVWDSLSILEYISEKYLDNRGWPQEQSARAYARSISSEMHSSFANVRKEMPMNCRKQFDNIELSSAAKHEIERIKYLWSQCRTKHGNDGEWLFGDFSIADAMYAPIALRFFGYNIPLCGIDAAYMNSILNLPAIKEWVEAGKVEKEIIEADEIESRNS